MSRAPLMPTSRGQIRRLCVEVDPGSTLVERRSLFWNAVAPASGSRALGRLLRLPRRRERDARAAALERVGLRGRADEPVGRLSPFDRMRFLHRPRAGPRPAAPGRPRALTRRSGAEDVGGLLALLRLIARSDRLGGGREPRRRRRSGGPSPTVCWSCARAGSCFTAASRPSTRRATPGTRERSSDERGRRRSTS